MIKFSIFFFIFNADQKLLGDLKLLKNEYKFLQKLFVYLYNNIKNT